LKTGLLQHGPVVYSEHLKWTTQRTILYHSFTQRCCRQETASYKP